MFEMSYRNVDGKLVHGGMAFDAPGHSPVFVTRNSSIISRKDWPKMKHALDALPGGMAAPQLDREDELRLEHEQEMRDAFNELEEGFGASRLDAHPTIRAFVTSIRNKYCSHHHSIRGKPPGARDDDIEEERAALRENGHDPSDDGLAEFASVLRRKGVDEEHVRRMVESLRRALESVREEEDDPVEDRFPISGPAGMGGRMALGYREHAHQPTFRSRDDEAVLQARDAAARVGFVPGPASPARRLTSRRERALAMDNVRAEMTGVASIERRFGAEFAANIARIKTTSGRG
jgi:hypothetical protein